MSKKLFEHIEKKFREAAENYQPPVTPQAWERMAALLDNDANGKRRPAGFWLWALLLLIVTGATGILIFNATPEFARPDANTTVRKEQGIQQGTEQNKVSKAGGSGETDNNKKTAGNRRSDNEVAAIEQTPAKQERVKQDLKPAKSLSTATASPEKARRSGRNAAIAVAKQRGGVPAPKTRDAKNDHRAMTRSQLQNLLGIEEDQSKASTGDEKSVTKREAAFAEKTTVSADVNEKINTKDTNLNSLQKQADSSDKKATTSINKRIDARVPETKQQQISVPEISSRLYFTTSLGLDGNAVKGSSIKQLTGMYGIGIGYNLNNRFSIRTGVYAGNKRYRADSGSYKLKGNYWRMVDIKAIDANCYVINFPVSIRYDFLSYRKAQFYAVGGLSSYFMQKEAYLYIYSYRNSDSLRYRTEVYGDNRHWFSVLDLSVGYEHRLSRRVSIQGEPYLKLPLNGVGDGKVQLYSAGLIIGLKFTPY